MQAMSQSHNYQQGLLEVAANEMQMDKDSNQSSFFNIICQNFFCDEQEIKVAFDDIIYQLDLSMLFLQNALNKNYDFYLSSLNAQKFDRVFFTYYKNEEYRFLSRVKPKLNSEKKKIAIERLRPKGKIYRVLQVKPKLDPEKNKITIKRLLSEDPEETFNLKQLFIDFCSISKNYQDKIKDFIICTNIDFSSDIHNNGRLTKIEEEEDDILNNHVKCYKFNFDNNSDIIKRITYVIPYVIPFLEKIWETREEYILNKNILTKIFFEKLVFAVKQSNEETSITEIYKIINHHVRDNFQINLIYDNIQTKMLNWLKELSRELSTTTFFTLMNSKNKDEDEKLKFITKEKERIVRDVLLPNLQYSSNNITEELRCILEYYENPKEIALENLIASLIPQDRQYIYTTKLKKLNDMYYSIHLENITRDINSISKIQKKYTNVIVGFLTCVNLRIHRLEDLKDLKNLQSFFTNIIHHPNIIAYAKLLINQIDSHIDIHWEQRILLSRILKILTPEMSKEFNLLLNKFKFGYAKHYCNNILFYLINYFIDTMETEDLPQVDKLAFLKMIIKFSEKRMRYKKLPFSYKQVIITLHKIIQNLLNEQNEISEIVEYFCVLKKYDRIELRDTIDPNTVKLKSEKGFECVLLTNYKIKIRELYIRKINFSE